MKYFLGIDAGGTKTVSVVANQEKVLARAAAGSIKLMRVSEAEAEANLQAMLTTLREQAGIDLAEIVCTCVGLAGITVPRVQNWTRSALAERVAGTILLCGDEEIALDAAFEGGPGVLVLAGTGSNIVGRSRDGQMFHVGGWGPVLADEGSGHWIGVQGLRAAFRALDRGETIPLMRAIQRHWQVNTIDDVVDLGNRIPGPDFSQLAPVVAQCAEQGDPVAIEVLDLAGEELARCALLAQSRIQAADGASAKARLAYSGSILSHIERVRRAMLARVRQTLPQIDFRSDPVDPAMGAIWRARQPEQRQPLQ